MSERSFGGRRVWAGGVRVVLLMLSDLVCLVATWAFVVWAYRALGLGHYKYGAEFYLRLWPMAIAYLVLNSMFRLYHGSILHPAAPLNPIEELRRLVALDDQARAIVAPHAGYVATVEVKEGDVYDGSHPMLTITRADTLPTLRADVSELDRTVTEKMTVSFNPDSYDAVETKVIATGTDDEGKKYADIEMTEQLIKARGSVYAMTQEDTTMTLIFRAREATSLLPTSAVRGSGDDRYVYVTEQNTAAFGGDTLRIHRMDVTVVGEYGGTTSIQEDISYYTIAYGEDRAISDGDAVMEYLK